MSRKRIRRSRRGASLVETLVIMTCASAVLTLSTVWIARTMRAHSRAETFHREEATAWRLSGQLRADASRAASNRLVRSDESVTLVLTPAKGGAVSYRFEGPRVLRTQAHPSRADAREEFAFSTVDHWDLGVGRGLVTVGAVVPEGKPLAAWAPLSLQVTVRIGAPNGGQAAEEDSQ